MSKLQDKDFSNAQNGAFERELNSITHTLRKFGFNVKIENFEAYGYKGLTAFHIVDPEHKNIFNYIAKQDTSGIGYDGDRIVKSPYSNITTPKQGIAELAYCYRKEEIPIPEKYITLLNSQNLHIAKVENQVIVYEQSNHSLTHKLLNHIAGNERINSDNIHIVMGYQDNDNTTAVSLLTKEELDNSKEKLVDVLNNKKSQVNQLDSLNSYTTKSNFAHILNNLDSTDKIKAFAKQLTTGKQAQLNVRTFERNIKQIKDGSEQTKSIIKAVKKAIKNEINKQMSR